VIYPEKNKNSGLKYCSDVLLSTVSRHGGLGISCPSLHTEYLGLDSETADRIAWLRIHTVSLRHVKKANALAAYS
jgi:hypothetical protein